MSSERPHGGLAACAGTAFAHPGRTLAIALATVAAALVIAVGWLRLKPGHHDLLDEDAPFHARYRAFEAAFGDDLEYALVLVDTGGTPDGRARARAFLDDLAARAGADTQHIASVQHRLDLSGLRAAGLHYLAPAELTAIAEHMERAPWLGRFTSQTDPGRALAELTRGIRDGLEQAERGDVRQAHAVADLAEALVAAASHTDTPTAIADRTWAAERTLPASADGYLDIGGRYLLATVEFREDPDLKDNNVRALAALRTHLDAVRAAHVGVDARLTGRPVLNADEMITSRTDMTLASIVAMALVGGLFLIAGRSLAPALAALVVLVAAICWTLAAATLTVGHLNLLSIVFFVILIGLGVDFAVHLAARQQELRAAGTAHDAAVRDAAGSTGRGLVTAALSTALAFFAVGLSAFRGIRELGIISGLGVLLSGLAAFTVWPALCGWIERRGWVRTARPIRMPAHGALTHAVTRPVLGVVLAVVLTVAGTLGIARVRFDGNLLAMQDPSLESVRTEIEWLSGESFSSWFGVLLAPDATAARDLRARLADHRSLISTVVTATDWIPAEPASVTEPLVQRVASAIPVAVTPGAPADLPAAIRDYGAACAEVGEWVFEARTAESAAIAGRLTDAADALEAALPVAAIPADAVARCGAMLTTMVARLRDELEQLRASASPTAPTLDTLPTQLRERFVAADGRHLVQVFPARSLWNDTDLAEFCNFLSAIDPEATGVPFQVHHSATLMKQGYRDAAWYALIAIALLLLVDFRSLRDAVLGLVPLALGGVWTLGVMGWTGIPWNLANLMAVPLLIGIGVDTGVHLLHRWRAGESPSALLASSTGHAVALSAATTMCGFASLLVAHHRGIFSLGLVMVIGLASVLTAGLLVLPALLAVIRRD